MFCQQEGNAQENQGDTQLNKHGGYVHSQRRKVLLADWGKFAEKGIKPGFTDNLI